MLQLLHPLHSCCHPCCCPCCNILMGPPPLQAIDGLQRAIEEILDPDEWREGSREHMHRTLGLAAVAQALQNYSKPLRWERLDPAASVPADSSCQSPAEVLCMHRWLCHVSSPLLNESCRALAGCHLVELTAKPKSLPTGNNICHCFWHVAPQCSPLPLLQRPTASSTS